MAFLQDAPRLPHPFREDRSLQDWLSLHVPAGRQEALHADLQALADYACMAYARRMHTPRKEPVLTQWDAWGARTDRIELTPAWREGPGLTARHGLLAAGHDDDAGALGRVEQFLRVYVYHVASEFYTCPLAMTDGAATAIKASGNRELASRALPHFLSRDPDRLWLSGQWMTETTGGSDVHATETVARKDDAGNWRLYGRKWFTSAVVGEAALALARPEGADTGADALALFYVETRDADGNWHHLTVDRLKDKLGTRELPTAEIQLQGIPAQPVAGLSHGVRQITPVLNITRTWNAVCAVASMARCIALARDYATRRMAFGKPLIHQPLHARTLADMQVRFEASFALSFHVVTLLGKAEHGQATAEEEAALRLLTPLAKLWTGKLAVALASEALECFGGAGYVEDTGLPQLLRDAQVYPIWEGTTNVLSLDTLRALSSTGLAPLRAELERLMKPSGHASIRDRVRSTLDHAQGFLERHASDRDSLQAGARQLALSLARCTAAALLAGQAARAGGPHAKRMRAVLDTFLAHGLDCLDDARPDPDVLLA